MSKGVMEFWSEGVMRSAGMLPDGYFTAPILHYSNTPISGYAI